MVFDNGSNRVAKYGGNSRGQVYAIDQTNMTASIALNADLGAYAPALGSAQVLLNGDYMFFAGNIPLTGKTVGEVQNAEFAPTGTSGTLEYEFQGVGPSRAYRGWRLPDLYHASLNGSAGPE